MVSFPLSTVFYIDKLFAHSLIYRLALGDQTVEPNWLNFLRKPFISKFKILFTMCLKFHGQGRALQLVTYKEVFATNSNFLILILLQSDGVNLWYFKLRLNVISNYYLFDFTPFIVNNIKGLPLQHRVAKIWGLETQSLWQNLNSFENYIPAIVEVIITKVCFRHYWK